MHTDLSYLTLDLVARSMYTMETICNVQIFLLNGSISPSNLLLIYWQSIDSACYLLTAKERPIRHCYISIVPFDVEVFVLHIIRQV